MPSLNFLSASIVGLLSLGASAAYADPSAPGLVASTYFAGFHANKGFPIAAMPWNKYTDAKWAFAYVSIDIWYM